MKEIFSSLAVCLCLAAQAGDIAVRNYEVADVAATNDVSHSGGVWFASRGVRIEKGGMGDWELSPAAVQTRCDVPVAVREGRLRIVDAPAPALERPDCLGRAALWLDATKSETLEMAEDGVGVARWYDVREKKGDDGLWTTNHYCAEAKVSFCTNLTDEGVWEKYVNYPVVKTYDERPGLAYVDFNGRSSGTWMRLMTPVRTDLAELNRIHHVFVCGFIANTWGFVLGANPSSTIFWHPGSTSGDLSPMWHPNSSWPTMWAGASYWNGEEVDGASRGATKGAYAYEWAAAQGTGRFGNFFNDRNIWSNANGWRCGGDSVGEVVVFTNRLSELERQQVGEWLVRRWAAEARPGSLAVTAAPGASASLASQSAATVDGAGTLEVEGDGLHALYSATKPYLGDTRVAASSVKLASVEPTLKALPGEALTVARDDFEVLSVVRSEDAGRAAQGAAALTLSSAASVRVAALSDEVKKLGVDGAGGTLILSAPRTAETPLRPASDIYAAMPNADMEAWQSGDTAKSTGTAGQTLFDWTLASRDGESTALYFVNLANARAGGGHWMIDGARKATFLYDDYPFQGNVVMVLKQGCVVTTPVTFPADGDYELTFLTGGRMNYDGSDVYAGGWTKMSLVDAAGATNEIGTALAYVECSTRHQRFKVREVKAGAYTFVLNHAVGSGDAHSIFDDFRFRLVTDVPSETAIPLPNGDFERADFTWNGRTKRSVGNVPAAWTLAQSTNATPDVCLVTRGMTDVCYKDSDSEYGGIQLALYGDGGTATSAEMLVPAGTWRLRCRAGSMLCTESSVYRWNGLNPNSGDRIQAWLVDDAGETSLGATASWRNPAFRTVTFTTPFTVAEPRRVRFKISQVLSGSGNNIPCALVDDFELVRVDDGELVVNGTFADESGWTLKSIRDGSEYTAHSIVAVWGPCRLVGDLPGQFPYGVNYGLGARSLDMCQCGTATQPMTFPEAGTYRLEFSARSRVWVSSNGGHSLTYSGNQASFFLVDDAGVTNEIYRTPSLTSSNFVFRTALFTVPKAGTYTFGVLSLNGLPLDDGTYLKVGRSATDVELFIDQISVRKAAEDMLPDLPEKLELDLARGVKLRLDYAGTMELDTLRLNGVSTAGLIDASHPSGLVCGTGSLYVRPKATVLLFR